MLTISLQHAEGRAIPLEINRHHIKVGIKNQLATTRGRPDFRQPERLSGRRYLYLSSCGCCSRFKTCAVC